MDKKEKIIEAAAAVFAQKGYFSANVDEIARAAGTAKGTIYYNFGSKSTLYLAVLNYGVDMILCEMDKSIKNARSTKDAIADIMKIHVEMYAEYPEMAPVFFRDMSSGMEPDVLLEVGKIKEKYMVNITEILKSAQKTKDARPGDPRLMSAALIGTISGMCSEYLSNPDGKTKREVITLLTDIAFSGIAYPGAEGK